MSLKPALLAMVKRSNMGAVEKGKASDISKNRMLEILFLDQYFSLH